MVNIYNFLRSLSRYKGTIVNNESYINSFHYNDYKEKVNIYYDRKDNVIFLLIILSFATWYYIFIRINLYLFSLFLILVVISLSIRIFKNKPVIIISKSGIKKGNKQIEWRDIKDIYVESIDENPGNGYFMNLILVNKRKVRIRLTGLSLSWDEISYVVELFRRRHFARLGKS